MEPIRKISASRTGLEGPEALNGLWRLARDERRHDERDQPRKDRRKAPPQPAVHRDDEGRPHVDVQA